MELSTPHNIYIHSRTIKFILYFICALSEIRKPFPNLICDNINFMLKLFVYKKKFDGPIARTDRYSKDISFNDRQNNMKLPVVNLCRGKNVINENVLCENIDERSETKFMFLPCKMWGKNKLICGPLNECRCLLL